jgi:hypothetical protein
MAASMGQGVAVRQRDRTPRAAMTDRRRRRGGLPAAAVLGGAAALALASTAAAAPSITGSDGDVWNAGSPEVRYVLTTDVPAREISWTIQRLPGGGGGLFAPRAGQGPSPVTLTLPGDAEGTFRITARDLLFPVRRTFAVDRTPPAVRIVRPADGARITQGTVARADYACTGAVRCAGSVPSGALLDTSRPGPAALRVDAADEAGNATVAQAAYLVVAPPTTPAPTPPGPSDPPPAPDPGVGSAGSATGTPLPPWTVQLRARTPRTMNAARLRPRLGARVASRRPVLAWPAMSRARLYNVQVFRLRPSARAVKVASLFPRANRVRIPPGRLVDGARYAWRVWPFTRTGYTSGPLGLSVFSVALGRG